MSHLGFHVNFRLADGRVLAPTVGARRCLARCLLQSGRNANLLALAAADNHVHFTAHCDRRTAAEVTRRSKLSLHHALDLEVPFVEAHYEPIHSLSHSYRSFWYDLRQEAHHGTSLDPLYEGTNLPDLLGLRVLGAYTRENVHRALPRVREAELWALFGPLEPAPPRWDLLGEAAAAAIGVPTLVGRSEPIRLTRAAALVVARPVLGGLELAEQLHCGRRTIDRLRAQAVPPQLVTAVRRQLELRSSVAARDAARTLPHAGSPSIAPLRGGTGRLCP